MNSKFGNVGTLYRLSHSMEKQMEDFLKKQMLDFGRHSDSPNRMIRCRLVWQTQMIGSNCREVTPYDPCRSESIEKLNRMRVCSSSPQTYSVRDLGNQRVRGKDKLSTPRCP